MQSFIQRRNFRRAVEAQHKGASEKLHHKNQIPASVPQPTASPSASGSQEKDLEKGDSGSEASHNATGAGNLSNPTAAVDTRDHAHPHEEVEDLARREEDDSEDGGDAEMRRTLSRTSTQATGGTALGNIMTGVNIRRRTTNEGGDGNVFIVGYHNDKDELNPHNWSTPSRMLVTFLVAAISFIVGFASSVDSSALSYAAKEFHVSEVTESLATGKFHAPHYQSLL